MIQINVNNDNCLIALMRKFKSECDYAYGGQVKLGGNINALQ